MSLGFSVSPASDVPIFRQLVQQIQRGVAVGKFRVGEQLPAVRVLAEELVINPNTVARAYQELIRAGVLESQAGRGVFVSERRQVFSDAERGRRLAHSARQFCHEALLLDAGLPEAREILERAWEELRPAPEKPQTRKHKK